MTKEKILCFEKKSLPYNFESKRFSLKKSLQEISADLNHSSGLWIDRNRVEEDPHYKQVIPYIIVHDTNYNLFVYRRKGNEKRLHGLWSCGIGGHVDSIDQKESGGWIGTIKKGAERELLEEIGITGELNFLGIINEEETKVGEVHLGMVFSLLVHGFDKIKTTSEVKTHRIVRLSDISDIKLETWSNLALELL